MEQDVVLSNLPAVMTWKLTGSTYITDISGVTTLNIDLKSYSSSVPDRGTSPCFMVKQNGGSWTVVRDITVSGTGTYSYTCMNIYGRVQMEAQYVSMWSKYYRGMKINSNTTKNISHTGNSVIKQFYRTYSSTFGLSSTTINNHFEGYVGYDGNQVLYLANDQFMPSGDIFNSIDLEQVHDRKSCSGRLNKNAIVGDTSYIEADDGSNQNMVFQFNLTTLGSGPICTNEGSFSSELQPQDIIIKMQTENANSATVFLLPVNNNHQIGINVSSSSSKLTSKVCDMESLLLDGLSIVSPVPLSDAITLVQACQAAKNLVECANASVITSDNKNNQPASVKYQIEGGSASRNFYGAGLDSFLCLPNSELDQSFTLCVTYETQYCCIYEGTSVVSGTGSQPVRTLINGATAKENLNFEPANYLYSNVPTSLDGYTLYLKNDQTCSLYRLVENKGMTAFYANPGTAYQVYSYMNGVYTLLEQIPGSILTSGSSHDLNLS